MLLKALVTLTVAGNLIGFGMAIRRHFARPEGMPLGTRLMTLLGYPFGFLHVASHALADQWVPWRVVAGLLLCGISAGLCVAALRANHGKPLSLAGSNDAPEHLNLSGPHARIRHPFYASYFYTWTGSALMGRWWLWSAPLMMGALYWYYARAEEQKFLSSPLADDYRAYMTRTGRFWPKILCKHFLQAS